MMVQLMVVWIFRVLNSEVCVKILVQPQCENLWNKSFLKSQLSFLSYITKPDVYIMKELLLQLNEPNFLALQKLVTDDI